MFPFNARSNTFKIDVTATASGTKTVTDEFGIREEPLLLNHIWS